MAGHSGTRTQPSNPGHAEESTRGLPCQSSKDFFPIYGLLPGPYSADVCACVCPQARRESGVRVQLVAD